MLDPSRPRPAEKRVKCPRCPAVFDPVLVRVRPRSAAARDLCPLCRREMKRLARRLVREYIVQQRAG
mgnify:CR=1 FL=1